MSNLELSEVWNALVDAGATVYEWVDEDGVSTGVQAILIGKSILIASDSDGYELDKYDEDSTDLVPADQYDDESAILAASDVEGYFAVAGLAGSSNFKCEWFATKEEAEAADWAEGARLAAELFDEKYRDGNRVYFQHKQTGSGFEPKFTAIMDED